MDAVSCIMCCSKSTKTPIKKKASLSILNPGYASSSGGSKLIIQSSNKFILKFSKIVLTGSAEPTQTSSEELSKSGLAKRLGLDFRGIRSIFI
jgi:hypothetical protein